MDSHCDNDRNQFYFELETWLGYGEYNATIGWDTSQEFNDVPWLTHKGDLWPLKLGHRNEIPSSKRLQFAIEAMAIEVR